MQAAALCVAAVIALTAFAQADPPSAAVAGRLADHLAPHPRLLFNADGLKQIAEHTAADPRLSKLRSRVVADADLALALEPLERKLTGRRLLGVSRDALQRIGTLSLAYRLTDDTRYADGARSCMRSVCGFTDFNPAHFLDTAEMTTALAIGYDWLHDVLPPEEKTAIRRAILDKALNINVEKEGWLHGKNNWVQVCHGGLSLGALAIAEDEPAMATKIIARAIDNVPGAMAGYAPDGAYREGPSYWEYGTLYNSLMIAALDSALGDDFGLTAQPGYLKSADFHLHTVGPTGRLFSYSDGNEKNTTPSPPAFFIASKRADPTLLFNDLDLLDRRLAAKPTARGAFDWLILIWAAGSLDAPAPTATHYAAAGVTPVATHRSGWTPDATFIAIKGGSPAAGHAHMDAGSFALDMAGERWGMDLGAQDYNSLESRGVKLWAMPQGSQRWDVFRIGSMSHNILTVNGLPQVVPAMATITKSTAVFTIINTGPVYADQLASATRGVMLRPDRSVRIQDEITATPSGLATPPAIAANATPATMPSTVPAISPAPAVVRWAMMTEANVAPDGASAILTQNGKTVRMTVVSPAGAVIKIASTVGPHDYDVANPGTRLVMFEVPLKPNENATLAVDFTPESMAISAEPIVPLAKW